MQTVSFTESECYEGVRTNLDYHWTWRLLPVPHFVETLPLQAAPDQTVVVAAVVVAAAVVVVAAVVAVVAAAFPAAAASMAAAAIAARLLFPIGCYWSSPASAGCRSLECFAGYTTAVDIDAVDAVVAVVAVRVTH